MRQLENVIERAIVLGSSEVLRPEDLPDDLFEEAPKRREGVMGTYHEVLRETKRRLFETAFHRADGDYNEAAALLGLFLQRRGLRHGKELRARPRITCTFWHPIFTPSSAAPQSQILEIVRLFLRSCSIGRNRI